MRILGIDPATNHVGYSIFEDYNLIKYGSLDLTKTGTTIERIITFKDWMIKICLDSKIELVGLEDIWLGTNKEVFKVLAKTQGALEIALIENQINYHIFAPNVWRQMLEVTGRQREVQKRAALNWVLNKYNLNLSSDDVAEGICIGYATYQWSQVKTF